MTRARDPDRMPFAAHASLLLQFLSIAQGITLCASPPDHPGNELLYWGLGVSALLTLAMFLRQNWARFAWLWGYAVLGILQPVPALAAAASSAPPTFVSANLALADLFYLATTLLALVLVFLPSSSRWFRGESTPSRQQAWTVRDATGPQR